MNPSGIEEIHANYWQRNYGERGRLCHMNCNVFLIKLRVRYTDEMDYERCMKKCVTSKKNALDYSHRKKYYSW